MTGRGFGIASSGRSFNVSNRAIAQSVIPDSALLHFPFQERSDSTLVEKLEGADGTANGLTNQSGTWWDNYAEDGDGSNDYGDLGNWSIVDFGANLDTNHAVILSFVTSDSGILFGCWDDENGGPNYEIEQRSGGDMRYRMFDDNGTNELRVVFSGNTNDGNKHRLVANKTGNSASDLEIWIDGNELSVSSIDVDENFGGNGTSNFTNSLWSHARNGDVAALYINATIDNIIPTNTDLTSEEIQDDYDNQPWS